MEGQDDLVVTARVHPENRQIYEKMVEFLTKDGMTTAEEINDHLFNIGLTYWISKVSEDLAAGPEALEDPEE